MYDKITNIVLYGVIILNNCENKKTFQDWCLDILTNIVISKECYSGIWNDKGFSYNIKNIIALYPEMYYRDGSKGKNGKEYIGLWWDGLSGKTIDFFFSKLLMSENAYKELHCLLNNKKPYKEYKKNLHLEHITPKGYIYSKLQIINESNPREAITNLMEYNKLVLLTKAESRTFLDGKGEESTFSEKDISDYNNHFGKNPKDIIPNKTKCKSDGDGMLRLIHLSNKGVHFCYENGNHLKEKGTQFNLFEEYFQDKEFVVSTTN